MSLADAMANATFLAARGDRDDRERVPALAVGSPPIHVLDICPLCGTLDYVTPAWTCAACATKTHEMVNDDEKRP